MSYIKEIHVIYSKNKCDHPVIYTFNEDDVSINKFNGINMDITNKELDIKKEELEVENDPDLEYMYIHKNISSLPYNGFIRKSINQDKEGYTKYIISIKEEKEYNKEKERKKQTYEKEQNIINKRNEQIIQLISDLQNNIIDREEFNKEMGFISL